LKRSKRARAILLYLPQYSPDLNPIDLAFGKLKALLAQDRLARRGFQRP